jgi:hypothetical protein
MGDGAVQRAGVARSTRLINHKSQELPIACRRWNEIASGDLSAVAGLIML